MSGRSTSEVEDLIAQAAGLRRLAVRLVGESDADDVLQEAVAAGIAGAPAERSALRHWLVRVVRNVAATRHRGDGRRAAREHAAARPERTTSTTDLVARMEVQRLVAEEVLRLDEPYRTAVLAVYFEGLGAEEYARQRGVPGATVRSWLKRGLEALRVRLDRRSGGDRAAWSACLLPLVRTETAAVPLAIGGGLVLKKWLAAAMVVSLAALIAWAVFGVGSREDSAQIADAAVELADPGEDGARDALAAAPAAEARAEIATAPDVVATSAARGPGVSGRVLWLPDREPAANIGVRLAPIELRPDRGLPPLVVTDADGRFRFDAVAAGDYDLFLDRLQRSTRVVADADGVHDVELTLRRATRVFGRVLALDGAPVANAEVWVGVHSQQWSRCVTRSAADGTYAVEGVTFGPFLFARAEGHGMSGSYMLPDEAPLRDIRLRPDVSAPQPLDLWLGGAPGAIEGRVTDAAGDALAGMQVEMRADQENVTDPAGVRAYPTMPEFATTDALGAFAFRGLRPGRTTLTVHSLYRTKCTVVVDVRSGATTRADIALPAMARVRGRITDLTGKGAPGAYFEALRADGTSASSWIITDADGNYDTGFVPSGRVRLIARHNRGRVEIETDLAPAEDREWSPVLGALAPIRGRVVDLARRPLAGISVSYGTRKQSEMRTDAAGRFELLAPAGAIAWVTAWASEGVRGTDNQTVWPGGPDVELVFDPPSAKITGRLLETNGQPAAERRVTCAGSAIACDAAGRFETPLLRSGPQVLNAFDYGVAACALITVDLAPGETRDVGDVTLPARGTLVVVPRFDAQVDRHRVEFRAQRLGAGLQIAASQGKNAGGDWTAEGLPEGEYLLTAERGGAATVEKRFAIRAGASTQVDVEIRRGVPVRVDVRGERIAGWTVAIHDAAGELVGTRSRGTWEKTDCVVVLRPGRYELVATTTDGRTGRARVEVKDGAALELYVAIDVP